VVFSIRSVSDPKISPRLSELFALVSSVEALSTYDVRVALSSPYAPVLFLLTVEVLPAHLLEGGGMSMEEFGRSPVGTGPFRFSEWKDGELVLEAYAGHFAGRPYLDSVVFRIFADRKRAWAELMQGTVDLVPDLEAGDYAVIEGDDRFQVREVAEPVYYTLLYNLQDPLLRDPAIREAIDLAIDRQDIIAGTLGGFAQETTGPFVPGTWAFDPELASNRHDPERSRALFASAGWTDSDGDGVLDRAGRQLELGMLVDSGDTLKVGVAQRIKWQLFGVGVKANVEFLQMEDLLRGRLLPGSFQTALLQFNAAGDPDTFLYLFWHSGRIGSSNLARYSSAAVDRLIEAGRVESDVVKRVDLYRSIHREMARDRPAAFLFVPRRLVGLSSRLLGVGATSSALYSSARTWRIGSQSGARR
jgi:peptide/nickel transport system substrate-binding protein